MKKRIVKRTKQVIFSILTALICVTSIQLQGLTIFAANSATQQKDVDVTTTQPTPEIMEHEPNNVVEKPAESTKQNQSTPDTDTPESTKNENPVEVLVAAGYYEEKDARTLDSKTFVKGDDAETIIYMSPVHYEKDGELVEYDLTFTSQNVPLGRSKMAASDYSVAGSDTKIVVPATISPATPIEIDTEIGTVTFSGTESLTQPTASGRTLVYPESEGKQTTIVSLETGVKQVDRYATAVPELISYETILPAGYILKEVEDKSALLLVEEATQKVVSSVSLPMVYDANHVELAGIATMTTVQQEGNRFTMQIQLDIETGDVETPPVFPVYVENASVEIPKGTVAIFGINAANGSKTYGPGYDTHPSMIMLGYVEPMSNYYPTGFYSAVASTPFINIADYVGENREITGASLSLLEFTAASTTFTDQPINFNVGRIESDYGSSFNTITWNSWNHPGITHNDTKTVSKFDNTFINFNIKEAIEAWYYGAPNHGLYLSGERQDQGLLFASHESSNSWLGAFDGLDGRPYITINHKKVEPIPDDYSIDETTVTLRPFTSADHDGVLHFQALGFDGIAQPNTQVEIEVYEVATNAVVFKDTAGVPSGLRTYPFYEPPLYPAIEKTQKYYGLKSNWQASKRLYTSDLKKNVEYGVRVQAKKLDGTTVVETGAVVESDHFQLYRATGFDRLYRVMHFYGLTDRNILMSDNHMRDELLIEGNELFLRNPQKNQGKAYTSPDLSEEDKKNIDHALIGRGKHCEFGYEPINLNTGNFYYTNEDTSWLDFGKALTFTRSYNSMAGGAEGIFGRNWSFTWDKQLTFLESGTAVYSDGTGKRLAFQKNPDGTFTSPFGEVMTLELVIVGYKDWTEEIDYYDTVDQEPVVQTTQIPVYEYVLKTKEQESYRFTRDGYLKEAILNQYEQHMTFEYDEMKSLKTITTSTGKVFKFTYNEAAYVSKIEQPDGSVLTYTYDELGNLETFTDAEGEVLTYEYLDAANPYLMTRYLDRENQDMIIQNTYDAMGRVIKQLDAKGDTVLFTYFDDHTEITSFDGSKEYVYFDAFKRTTKFIDKAGVEKQQTYDENNNMTSQELSTAAKIIYSYDAKGNILTEERADGLVKSYIYDAANNIISVRNFDGTETTFNYDAKNNMIGTFYADGTSITRTFDSNGQQTSETDRMGNTVTSTYENGNLVSVADALGTKITTYDEFSRITSERDANGNTVYFTRNKRGELIKQQTPNGTRHYQYDADGQKIYEEDGNGNRKTFTYDAWSRLIAETDSYGTKKYSYDAFGNMLEQIDELGNVTKYVYNSAHQLIETIQPDGSKLISTYDTKGRVIQSRDAIGNTITKTYDDITNALLTETDTLGRTTTYSYDVLGNLLKTVYPSGLEEQMEYNVLNQKIRSVDTKGNVTTYRYDANGNLVETVINDEKRTITQYGAADIMVAEVDASGNETRHVYNPAKVIETTTLANGATTSYTYDGEYNILTTTGGDGTTTSKTYDANRNVLSETDELGQTTTYTYTSRNQVATVTYPDGGVVQHIYDAKGQEIETIDQLGYRTTSTYDGMGRVIKTIDANGNVTETAYNAKGQPIETKNALGQKTKTTYTDTGLKATETAITGVVTTYVYDAFDRVIEEFDSIGHKTKTTYDIFGQAIATENERGEKTATVYDRYGNAVESTDIRGNKTKTTYDLTGKIVETLDAFGQMTSTTYTPIGQEDQVSKTSGASEQLMESVYSNSGLLEASIKNGEQTEFAYDAKHQITSITLPTGAVTSYTYTFDGKDKTVTDPNGGVMTYVYDKRGQLIQTIDPEGNRTQKVYDGNGNLIEEIDPLGYSMTVTYDALNRPIQTIDKLGNKTKTSYTIWGTIKETISTLGIPTTYEYDENGREIKKTNALCEECKDKGTVVETEYDAFDRVSAIISANGYTEYYNYNAFGDVVAITNNLKQTLEENEYDGFGRLIAKTDANENKTTYEYNMSSQVTKITAENGNTISYTYDKSDRIATMKDIRGNTIEYLYDPIGNLLATKMPGEREYSYTYDGNGNLLSETDALSARTFYTYNKNNQVVETKDALGQKNTTAYDGLGQIVAETDARGNQISYQYDANGNKVTETDAAGFTTTYGYDAGNRLSLVKNRLAITTTYAYDDSNNMIGVTDANGNQTTFTYDTMHNKTSVKNADGSVQKYRYDTRKNLIEEKDADGRAITYKYDALNNQIFKGFDDKNYVYSYNSENQVTAVTNQSEKSTLVYNAYGDLITYTDINGNSVSYVYDSIGQRTAIIYPDGRTVEYTYDKNSQLIEVKDGTAVTSYMYDTIGQLVETVLPNNTKTRYTYDENGNILTLRTLLVSDMTSLATTDIGVLQTEIIYEYDERNHIIKETSTIEGVKTEKEFTYDSEEQLIGSIHTTGSKVKKYTYTYDGNGNKIAMLESVDGKITNRQFSFDAANKLVEETGDMQVKYHHDKSGNVTKKEHFSGVIENFTYNSEGQLIQVVNNQGKTITYQYDGFGNRIEKSETTKVQEDNKKTLFEVLTPDEDSTFNENYDAELVEQETKEQLEQLKTTISEYTKTYDQTCPIVEQAEGEKESTKVLKYVNDINAAFTEVLQVQSNNYTPLETYVYGVQRITKDKENDTTTYYQYDGRGSVIGQQIEKNNALHFKISYNDFGKTNRKTDNEFGYNAESHDYAGTQYLRARYYNTDMGNFQQRDSYMGEQENPISQNRYTYVWNSPNKYVDKSGNDLLLEGDPTPEGQTLFEQKVQNYLVNTIRYQGISRACAEWEMAKMYKDSGGSLGDYARGVYNYLAPSPPSCGGQVNNGPGGPLYVDDNGETYDDRDDYLEAERKIAEEKERQLDKSIKEQEDIARSLGLNLEGLPEGMTKEEKLAYLIKLIKICEELASDNIDVNEAQKRADDLIPGKNVETENQKLEGLY